MNQSINQSIINRLTDRSISVFTTKDRDTTRQTRETMTRHTYVNTAVLTCFASISRPIVISLTFLQMSSPHTINV